jgi:single-strand DNA-binding protein
MNKAILVGNLTRDPEARTTPNGVSVTTFTVAINRRYKSQDGQQQTDFIPVVTWRGLAENCARYLSKGSKVGVVGMIQTRNYEDANGVRKYVTEIVADDVEFLTSRQSADRQGEYAPPPEAPADSADELFAEELSDFQPLDDAELPF